MRQRVFSHIKTRREHGSLLNKDRSLQHVLRSLAVSGVLTGVCRRTMSLALKLALATFYVAHPPLLLHRLLCSLASIPGRSYNSRFVGLVI
jgi:hypothetical protein